MLINTEQYKNPNLTPADRKAKVEANLKRLDYAEGNGLLSKAKKELLPKELYLFISSGGTGQKALRSIKETINKTIDSNYHAQVRYLVVDCAENELNQLVKDGVFEQCEVMTVPYEGAHETINQSITSDRKAWVDPKLYSATGGDAPGIHPGFENNGAGAWRQPGRVRLTSPGGIEVINKIQQVINGTQHPAGTKLKVFFLCSVAGGTGSGTIVDLVYMTRHVLETNFAGLYNNTCIFGYIFSPSACEGEINADRNPGANHYAAMKEIAYLMRLGDRGEKIKMNYGITNVTFNRNIFDTCIIVDGDTPAFGGFENPAKTARNVVVQSILGSMTARDVVGGEQVSLVDSIYSNSPKEVNTAIASLPLDRYPRYAGYSFNAAGFASVKVPVELLTSVVVHNIFKRLWDAWNEEPGRNAEIRFLNDCGIEKGKLIANIQSTNELLDKVEQKSREFIRRHGIMAMINVAGDAARLLENEYIPYASDKAKNAWFTKESWIKTTFLLTAVKGHLIGLNNTVWETSRIVLETFHDLLERESRILTDVRTFENNFNKTLYFCSINLTQSMATQRQANALMEFITGIYEGQEDRIIEDFIDEILLTDNLAKLAGVTSADSGISAQFDPAGMIRSFIERRFETIINENIEIFLVKFFSGNPQAETTQPDPNDPAKRIATDDLKRAAQEIYNTLTTKGAAMANTLGGIENRVSGRRFITVPKKCTHLFEEIEKCAKADGARVKAYKSESDDELLMITMLQGLPALSFQTTAQNEPVYEAHWNGFPGIHIEQCGSGIHNWVNLPNLVFNGNQPREQRNLRAAKDDYDAAVALGMVMNSPNYPDQQIKSIFRLNKTQDVGSVTERWMIPEFEGYITDSLPNSRNDLNLEYCLNQLEQNGVISRVDLMQQGDNLSAIGSELPADFYYDYAWHTLRQMFHLWHAVKETIPYVKKLKDAIDAKRNELEKEERMKDRRTTFAQALRAYETVVKNDGTTEDRPVLIRFVRERVEIKKDGTNWSVLTRIGYSDREPNSTLYKECKEYFTFVAFSELPEADYNSIRRQIEARKNIDEVWAADQERGSKMAQEFRDRSSKDEAESDSSYPMASVEFSDEAERIEEGLCDKLRKFYTRDIQAPIAN